MSRLLSFTLRSQLSKRLAASVARKPAVVFALPKIAATTSLRSFHATPLTLNKADLKQVLEEETKILETIPNDLDPAHAEFLETSGFEVVEKPGTAGVELIKKTKDGQIVHVYFDVEEVADFPDQELDPESLEENVESFDQIFSNVKVLVEDPVKNEGLFFNILLQPSEEALSIDFFNHQPNVKEFIAKIKSEGEFVDKFNYQGPKFAELDEALQAEFENYLTEFGINTQLSEFILGYSDVKEDSEYRIWLKSVNSFFN